MLLGLSRSVTECMVSTWFPDPFDPVPRTRSFYMSVPKKPIRLTPELDGLLRKIYVQIGVPRDQFKRRPKDKALLGSRWQKLSDRDDPPEELIRYIKNQQKAKSR